MEAKLGKYFAKAGVTSLNSMMNYSGWQKDPRAHYPTILLGALSRLESSADRLELYVPFDGPFCNGDAHANPSSKAGTFMLLRAGDWIVEQSDDPGPVLSFVWAGAPNGYGSRLDAWFAACAELDGSLLSPSHYKKDVEGIWVRGDSFQIGKSFLLRGVWPMHIVRSHSDVNADDTARLVTLSIDQAVTLP